MPTWKTASTTSTFISTPRNYQEFYYGKGKGNRIDAHLRDEKDSQKSRVIREIKKEGREPIRKVIAINLTETEALLIEKTLIWKLGRTLTNKSSGHFAKNFREQNTLHKDLFGFDFENGVYCVNVGEGKYRCWDDCLKFGFMSGGQDWKRWGSKISRLQPGDIVCAYLSRHGYVGVGQVEKKACPAVSFKYGGKTLSKDQLKQPNMLDTKKGIENSEYLLEVRWIATKDRKDAVGKSKRYWRARSVLASLETQPTTLAMIEKEFGVQFTSLLKGFKQQT